jgi:apolipoprotein N-acyltransferase
MSGDATFRVAAIVSATVGVLFLSGTWDGLYDALDLPQALPALGPQIGGMALLGFAFLFWSAAASVELRRPVAIAGVLLYLGAAVLIASWLIFRDKVDLEIGDSGVIVLIVVAVLFAALGAALVGAGRSSRAR